MARRHPHKQILRTLALGTLAAASLMTAGCEKEEDAKIAVAQDCLDAAADAASANACVAKIEGINTPQAYLIRCSAGFIAQGLTGARIASAFEELNKSGGATSPTTAALGFFTFKANGAGTADQNITAAMTNCEASGVRSMLRLATMAKLATTVSNLGNLLGGVTIDPATQTPEQLQTAVTNAINAIVSDNSTTNAETIGTIAQQANTAYCNPGSSFETNDVCKKLGAALDAPGGTTADIGRQLLACLQNPTAAGCQ